MLPLLLVSLYQEPQYFRAALEEAAVLAAGSVWYWIDDRNIVDWDNPSLKERLTGEAWRFDNNTFPINFAWHAGNGAGFHAIARANGLSLPASFGYGFATSMVWEYVLEFKEKVSINDVVITPGAGLPIGEFVYWTGAYLGYPGLGHEVVDGCPEQPPEVDGAFLASYGFGVGGHELRAAGAVRPKLGLPTTLAVRVPITADGAGIDGIADTLLWPYVSIAYRYRNERLGDWKDRVSLLHLPGLAVDRRAGPIWASLRANLDVGGLDAAAFVDDPAVTEKTVLERHRYYYAWGWSARAAVELEHGWAAAGGSFFYGQYRSIEGLDRNQEEVDVDVEAADIVLDYDIWLRARPWGPWFVQGRLSHQERDSDVGDAHADRKRRRYLVEVGRML